MKQKIFFIFVVVILASVLGGYYIYGQKNSNTKNFTAYENKDHYEVGDFKDSTLEQSDMEAAVARINKLYELKETSSDKYTYWIDIGIYKKLLNDFVGAEEAWMKAIESTENPDVAYGNLANIYFYNLRNYELAEEYYKKAIEITKNPFTYREGISDIYRYNLTAKKDLIEQNMLDGVESDPIRKLNYYEYLYYYFADEKNQDKTAEYLKKIKEIRPDWESDIQNVSL